jgi:hypothetical protein
MYIRQVAIPLPYSLELLAGANFVELRKTEVQLRRIYLLSTRVNRLQDGPSPKIHRRFIALCFPSGRER